MTNRDEFDGQGGTYEVKDGKRVLKEGSRTKPSEGGGARDKDGQPFKEDTGYQAAPALPPPPAAPWSGPEPDKPAPASGNVKALRNRGPQIDT